MSNREKTISESKYFASHHFQFQFRVQFVTQIIWHFFPLTDMDFNFMNALNFVMQKKTDEGNGYHKHQLMEHLKWLFVVKCVFLLLWLRMDYVEMVVEVCFGMFWTCLRLIIILCVHLMMAFISNDTQYTRHRTHVVMSHKMCHHIDALTFVCTQVRQTLCAIRIYKRKMFGDHNNENTLIEALFLQFVVFGMNVESAARFLLSFFQSKWMGFCVCVIFFYSSSFSQTSIGKRSALTFYLHRLLCTIFNIIFCGAVYGCNLHMQCNRQRDIDDTDTQTHIYTLQQQHHE